MIHKIKILKKYADAKIEGIKPFEIRKNDRKYKVNDQIMYTAIDSETGKKIEHEINKKVYEIVYITNFMQIENYIVFSDKELPSDKYSRANDMVTLIL